MRRPRLRRGLRGGAVLVVALAGALCAADVAIPLAGRDAGTSPTAAVPSGAVVPGAATPTPEVPQTPALATSAAAPTLVPRNGDPAGAPPPLHVAGNHLVDPSGDPVTLHGVDMSGTEYVCAQNWTTDPFGGQPEDSPQTFAALHSWGVKAVRVPLNEDCWLGINGVEIGGRAYQQPVEKLVRDLQAAGFYVIVDLHWSAPGSQRALAQNPAPDEDHSPAFWQGVATAFAGDQDVIFDLFNEPYYYWLAPGENEWTCLWHGCTLTQYVTGGSPYTVTAGWQTAGFDQLIDIIRATGDTNVIMAAGVNWARDLSGWLAGRPSDPNLVASWHSYPSANPSLQSECAAQWCWDQVIAPLAARVPVVVGETGDSVAGPEAYLPSFLPWAQSHGLSVLAWTWNAWTDPNDVLVTSMTSGTPTAGEGVLVRGWLQGLS
jgi:endoglucanase